MIWPLRRKAKHASYNSLCERLTRCESEGGREIVSRAITLAELPENAPFNEGQLIRLAYWGAPGSAT